MRATTTACALPARNHSVTATSLTALAVVPALVKVIVAARAALVPIGLGIAAYRLRPLGAAGDTSSAGERMVQKEEKEVLVASSTSDKDDYISKQDAEALFVAAGCSPPHASVAVDRCPRFERTLN